MTGLPNNLVLIRHGRTTANDVYSARRKGQIVDSAVERQILITPDWKHTLSQKGVEQIHQARLWLDSSLGGIASFDGLFTSPFVRARQSAVLLGPTKNVRWQVDDRLAEKHVGTYGVLTLSERSTLHAATEQLIEISPWYATYPGGENEMMVHERYRSFISERINESGLSSVLIVAHAGLIGAARYHHEKMLPEEYEMIERTSSEPIRNGSFLIYSKPVHGEYTRRRLVYPGSYDSGWEDIGLDRSFSDSDLRAQIDKINELT